MTKKRLSYEQGEEYLVTPNSFEDEILAPQEVSTKKDISAQAKALRMLLEDNLTKKQKCYIILYYKEGLTVKEIAAKFGVDKSTVSRTINRGRQRLAGTVSREALRRLFSDR